MIGNNSKYTQKEAKIISIVITVRPAMTCNLAKTQQNKDKSIIISRRLRILIFRWDNLGNQHKT